MCYYQTLYHDEKTGYVIRCSECEKIQVSYGNLLVTFNTGEFESFRRWLPKIRDEHQPSGNNRVRSLVIPTPCEGVKFVLSPRELEEYSNILELADAELHSLEMIKLFER